MNFTVRMKEVYNAKYTDTKESFDSWSNWVKQGLITGYDNTKDGFDRFRNMIRVRLNNDSCVAIEGEKKD